MKKRIVVVAIVSMLVLTGAITTAFYVNQPKKAEQKAAVVKNDKEISYKGKDGITALELLKQNADIETSGEGEMTFVTAINGVAANPKNQYWQFNINGESASVGAGSYTTKNTDTITWKLSSF